MPLANMTPLTDDQRALAGDPEHIALALRIARSMARYCPREVEAMESAALFGLVLAARTFDPALGVRFTTYTAPRITGAILDAARLELPKGFRRNKGNAPHTHSLSAQLNHSDYENRQATGLDTLTSDELPVGWELESLDAVEVLSCRLPARYGRAVRAYLTRCDTGTMKATAATVGLSESRVSQMLSTAANMLRETQPTEGT